MHQNVCSRSFRQHCREIFRKCWGTSHSTSEQRLEQFMVLLKLKSTFLKNILIVNRLFFLRISKHWNYLSRKFEVVAGFNSGKFCFLKFQNNFTCEFWTDFSYGLLLQQFLRNFSGILVISIRANTRICSQKYKKFMFCYCMRFCLNIRVYLSATFAKNISIIAEWYLLFFAKFSSHPFQNETVMTKKFDGATLRYYWYKGGNPWKMERHFRGYHESVFLGCLKAAACSSIHWQGCVDSGYL